MSNEDYEGHQVASEEQEQEDRCHHFRAKSRAWYSALALEQAEAREIWNKWYRCNPYALNKVVSFSFDGMFAEKKDEQ